MLSLNQKFLIKRNILLFKRLFDKIMMGVRVRQSIDQVAEETGFTYGVVRDVYYKKNYPHSPYDVFDDETGELIGKRSTKEIIEKAKLLIQEGESLIPQKSA